MPEAIWYYLAIINIGTFILFAVDKRRAVRSRWRIRERTLLIFCLLGGSMGGLIAMHLLRHKTRHYKFSLGVPIIFVLQIVLSVMVYQYWL